ncbi:tetratricopeptide repeat domain protein [Dissulfurispira thermophila]|uniref:Tetratricopeptide repeat domain protein n=2 Tax=root TaxID=1 RepID=A0A7G1H4X9_9BACT|nr:tetratricopeptide repeat protein [Dissulfurispira thermophila]BCB96966.1 tetratricopeptide repeat domain protein [Dissulfurispira thermophila]
MEDRIYRLIRQAEKSRERSEFRDSLGLFKKALLISKRHNIVDGILSCTIAIADIYRMTGNFDRALKNYEDALEASEAIGNRLTAADCMVGIGMSLRAMGMWKDAIRFISAARKIYKRDDDKKGIAFSLWAEAGALRIAGDITSAIKKFEESRDIFLGVKDKSGEAYSLCGLGGVHRIAGRFRESLSYYKQANDIFKKLKDRFGIAYSHCGIGNAFRMTGNYNDALRHFKKAVELYKGIGDVVSYSYTLWSLANVYKMNGNLEHVRAYIDTALRNFKKTKDPRGIIYCNLTLGELMFMQGRYDLAEKKLMSAFQGADMHGFKLERCHSEMLLTHIGTQKIKGRGQNCYKKIGVRLNFTGIPFNMP